MEAISNDIIPQDCYVCEHRSEVRGGDCPSFPIRTDYKTQFPLGKTHQTPSTFVLQEADEDNFLLRLHLTNVVFIYWQSSLEIFKFWSFMSIL